MPLVWPPQPIYELPLAPQSQLATGRVWGDVLYGFGVTVAFFLACGSGIFLIPILYFLERRRYPVFIRSMGWSYFIIIISLLVWFAPYLWWFWNN
jgi:hypothetical protein